MRLHDLEPWVARAWALSVAKARTADRVVALLEGFAIGAWSIRGAYPADETYTVSSGDERPRVALALGDPLPVLPAYHRHDLVMRRGVAVIDLEVPELRDERSWGEFHDTPSEMRADVASEVG